MKPWLHKVERIVDTSIPYLLVILFFVIIGEIFFQNEIKPYGIFVGIVDNFIILIFVLDLIFKYMRIRNFPNFFRKYWLEIIAAFPAFLILRLFERFIPVASLGETVQASLHETIQIEREGKLLAREIESMEKEASRLRYFSRFLRPIARVPRFLKAFSFYEKPTGRHHPHERK